MQQNVSDATREAEMGTWVAFLYSTWIDSRLDSTRGKGLTNILKATQGFYP